jgi:probable HAF family extracellular repeat protein
MRDLGAPNLQCGATPTSLNDRGQVVWYTFGTEEIRAYLSDGSGPPLRYETLGGDKSNAFDINNKGQIVGGCTVSTAFYSPWHAYRREPDGTMRDLGTVPGATSSMAYDINEQSQVVGESGNHAVLWEEGGAMRDLGTLDNQSTRALAINESGLVVGRSTVGSVDHAFLYDGSTMLDLNSLVTLPAGWTLTEAWDINNAGQIVGYANFNGLNRAFLLTPVPEPASVAGFCLLGMMFLRRSKH